MRGEATTAVKSGMTVPAPATGIHLGTGGSGPFVLRLFRPGPTRVAVVSGGFAAQLITWRAALSGVAVRVLSDRPAAWAPFLQHGPNARLVPESSPLLGERGPMVIVDDRPQEQRAFEDVADWQCLIDLRAVPSGARVQWTSAHLRSLAQADVALFGVLDVQMATAAARVFGLDAATSAVVAGGVPPQGVAMVARGRAEMVRVVASEAEAQVLRSAAR